MKLIANTGIHLFTKIINLSKEDNFKMSFCEKQDVTNQKIVFDLAHKFSATNGDVWVYKKHLGFLGYLQIKDSEDDGGLRIRKGDVTHKWSKIEQDFYDSGFEEIPFDESDEDSLHHCFHMNIDKVKLEKFVNQWLPMPFFPMNQNGKSLFNSTNWCRFKLVPINDGSKGKYEIIIAFDTKTEFTDKYLGGNNVSETPIFSTADAGAKTYSICNEENLLIDFCSVEKGCKWVDDYILKLYHDVTRLSNIQNLSSPKLKYLAEYLFLIKYIERLEILPELTLFSNKDVAYQDVDIVIDIGNSKTRAILFDNSDFTKVEALGLQNYTNITKNQVLNIDTNPFDMRLAFREADFGGSFKQGDKQFVYPSMVRLGEEAIDLIHQATNNNLGEEQMTTFSSPKRYLWDTNPKNEDWRFVTLEKEKSKSIWNDLISPQLNDDGSLNTEGTGGIGTRYSRKTLMTLSFLEIFEQANTQINSVDFRKKWGNEATPRKLGKIIVSCPTAMSRMEQVALRKAAEEAKIMLDRTQDNTYSESIDIREAISKVKIIPTSRNIAKKEERTEWIYDEATAPQFVYLYAELKERYNGKVKEYFDLYGKIRNDLDNYAKKSVTIGSIDIGAGTTDIMIAAHQYDDEGRSEITPVPLFWESFYKAGDDIVKDLIQTFIIEGEDAVIYNLLSNLNPSERSSKILDFFGKNNARQSITDRQVRNEFNLQVSIPVINYYLQLLKEDKVEEIELSYEKIFDKNEPTKRVLEHFENHFGFSIKSIKWKYNKNKISKVISHLFDQMIAKISTILSYYECDIVLLSGRPSSLKPITDLFYKYFAIAPNRLITLNDYRVGTWFPFQDGTGKFKDAKSNVAVGAMIGHLASTVGLNGFRINTSKLASDLLPTTDYFSDSETKEAFISPESNNVKIKVNHLPIRIWTRQLNSQFYPTRPFYKLDYNYRNIEDKIIKNENSLKKILNKEGKIDKQKLKDEVEKRLTRLRINGTYNFIIEREDYNEDKEALRIEGIETIDGDDLNIGDFTLQIQSMDEDENYWMDTGEFNNLTIGQNNN